MTSQPKLNRKEKESVGAGPSQDGGKKVLSGGKTAGENKFICTLNFYIPKLIIYLLTLYSHM